MRWLRDEWDDLSDHLARNWKVGPEALLGLFLVCFVMAPVIALLYLVLK